MDQYDNVNVLVNGFKCCSIQILWRIDFDSKLYWFFRRVNVIIIEIKKKKKKVNRNETNTQY